MLANYLANQMIKPGKAPVFGNPQEFDLDYEEVTFSARDGVNLSGWLLKGSTDKVIIQSHFGVQCSKSGYTPQGKGWGPPWPQDIQFLNQGKYLVDAGYSVLMYDFRNHGNSGEGTNPWVTWGPEEGKDVIAAVDFIANHPDYRQSAIGLLSICMGCGATTWAYGLENGLQKYGNVKTMVAVQPLAYAKFVRAMGMPNFLIKNVNTIIQQRTGIDFSQNTFLPYAKNISVPTLVIQNRNDPWTELGFVQDYYDQLTVEKDILWLDLEKKRFAAYDWVGKKPDNILAWFAKHVR